MTYTLNELLDETGAADLGKPLIKNAAAKPDFAKLAERCRRASEQPSADLSLAERSLAEKTAAVEIIRRTMAEIAALDGDQKVASASTPGTDNAAFIRSALEAGHDPQQIAEFLEKQAGLPGMFREWKAGRVAAKAGDLTTRGVEAERKAVRLYQSRAREFENLDEGRRTKFLENLRRKQGDAKAHALLSGNKAYTSLPSWKALNTSVSAANAANPAAAAAAKAKNTVVGLNIGGSNIGLSKDQFDKVKTPAMYLGAGLLAHRVIRGGGGGGDRKRSGPIIINS